MTIIWLKTKKKKQRTELRIYKASDSINRKCIDIKNSNR